MKDYLTQDDIKFIPLYNTTELIELGLGNSSFKLYDNRVEFCSIYPFTVVRAFVLKTKNKNYPVKVVEASQCGQSDFTATLKLAEGSDSLKKLILQSLKDFHS